MLQVPNGVWYGADPEAFLMRDRRIIGSEKVIPEDGLRYRGGKPIIVRDGVQIELNPPASPHVTTLGKRITQGMQTLVKHLMQYPGVSCCWDGVVEVSRDELDSLSPGSRILGCQPSKNAYGEKPITVDVRTYRKRSAGGHLHFGSLGRLSDNVSALVAPYDIFIGNACVMLDRDPLAAERRENYGRAGEYREPAYGLEYRTLSNFWLRNYALLDLVTGLANIAIAVVNDPSVEDELIAQVDVSNFIKAIDTNDYELAKYNFNTIRPLLAKHLPPVGFPLSPATLDTFLVFCDGVRDRGLTHFFPQDPVKSWCAGKQVSFTAFLDTIY